MNIKIIVANNDILYSNLSNTILENKSKIESKIEIIKISENKLNSFIYKNKVKDNFIIIDTLTSISFCINIIKNIINKIDNKNIIILVVDSRKIIEFLNQNDNQIVFRKHTKNIISLLDILNIVSDSIRETFDLEKEIDNILWKLGFASYFKGTIYLKDAIMMSFYNKTLLYDVNSLIQNIAQKHNIFNITIVRSIMDKTLNNILDLVDTTIIYNIFGDFYDGRKISLKYFINLCVYYLEEKNFYSLNKKRTTHS